MILIWMSLYLQAAAGFPWGDPDATTMSEPPIDPVLPINYTVADVAFEEAPGLVRLCRQLPRGRIWVLAQTLRPEGMYTLISGPIWYTGEEYDEPLHLATDYGGEVVLVTNDRSCKELWVPDNAFNDYFPDNPGRATPTPEEASIVHDLGVSLLQRAMRALGGREAFLRAFDATGSTDKEQDTVMIPLLDQLRKPNSGAP